MIDSIKVTEVTDTITPAEETYPPNLPNCTKVTIPKCTGHAYGMFQNCYNLEIVDCKASQIDGVTFQNCYKLTTLIIRRDTLAGTNANAFNGTPFVGRNGMTGTLYVPQSLVEEYKTATNWSDKYAAGYIDILPIEGSIYETQYADGTPIE